MKAKDYVKQIWDAHQRLTGGDEEQKSSALADFDRLYVELRKECFDQIIDRMKAANERHFFSKVGHLFAEASVKWNAVAHGLSQKVEGGLELYPFFTGGLLASHITTVIDDARQALQEEDPRKQASPETLWGTIEELEKLPPSVGLSSKPCQVLLSNARKHVQTLLHDHIKKNLTNGEGSRRPKYPTMLRDDLLLSASMGPKFHAETLMLLGGIAAFD